MSPVHLDVIALIPEGWGLCQSCETLMAGAGLAKAPSDRGLDEAPPELRKDFERLSALLLDLSARYGDQLQIHIFDPYSLPGLARAIRYGARRYPTFVISGREKIVGWEVEKLDQALRQATSQPGK